MNLPNQLTIARCVMAIIFVGILSFDNTVCYLAAYALFTAAVITDYYDGKIARSRNLITNFGKLFDPVADKVLMMAAFVMLMTIPELRIPGWTVVVIFAREFLVMGARTLAAADGTVIAANQYGKSKTALQMTYVFVFFSLVILFRLAEHFPAVQAWVPGGLDLYRPYLGWTSRVAIVLIAAYTVYSGIQFARINWHNLRLSGAS